jgi:hypothetical protein
MIGRMDASIRRSELVQLVRNQVSGQSSCDSREVADSQTILVSNVADALRTTRPTAAPNIRISAYCGADRQAKPSGSLLRSSIQQR